jgi:hypothetical protein
LGLCEGKVVASASEETAGLPGHAREEGHDDNGR